MSNSFPKRNLPLRVVLNRVGEATLAQYAAARDPMDSPETACQLWREVVAVDPCHEPDKEHLVAVLLNAKLRMIGYHVVSVGSLNEALAHPREIFRAAILAGAYALILMHNHPSGDPTPSEADRRLTKNIREAAGILQINLLDHVIVGSPGADRRSYFSFREVGTPMKPALPNFIFGAIYRTRSGEPDCLGNRRRVLLLCPGLSRHPAACPSRRLLGLRRIRAD